MAGKKEPYEYLLEAAYAISKTEVNTREGAMPTNALAIIEYVDGEGTYWFAIVEDKKAPKWRKTGMLYHAIDELLLGD